MSGFDTAAFVFFAELFVYGSTIMCIWEAEKLKDWERLKYYYKYALPIPFIYLAICIFFPKATP